MKIIKTISSIHPEKNQMIAKNFFGKIKGEVKFKPDVFDGCRDGYIVYIDGQYVGSATDFYTACNQLLEELGIVITENAR